MTQSQPSPNIILTGFMGTGKTTVGRLLAERLGREFVDIDDQIVAHFGKTIPEIFAEDGEAAFRVAEAQLCARLGVTAAEGVRAREVFCAAQALFLPAGNRVEKPDALDEAPVARPAAVGDCQMVKRAFLGAAASKTNGYHIT